MSKLTKAIKRVSAVAASALLLSSSAFANLGNYGSNFEKDGKFVGKVVVGSSVGADDVAAANVIINDLKTRYSSTEKTYELTYTKSEGSSNGESVDFGDDFFVGNNISAQESKFDGEDLNLLGERVFEDESGEEYDYEMEVTFNEQMVSFNYDSDLEDMGYTSAKPTYYVSLENNNPIYTLDVTFDDAINLSDENVKGSEIELFGRTFTFSNENDDSSDIKLLSSVQSITLSSDGKTSATVEYEGKSYTIKVLSASSDTSRANIEVNGVSKVISEADGSETINNLDLYIEDVFVSDIVVGGDSDSMAVQVKLSVGSDEVVIPSNSNPNEKKIEVEGSDLDNYKVTYSGTQEALTGLEFNFYPNKEDSDKNEVDFLLPGSRVEDPVFPGIYFSYDKVNTDVMEENKVEFSLTSGDEEVSVKFMPNYGNDQADITFLEYNAATNTSLYSGDYNIKLNEAAGQNLTVDDAFILQETDTNVEERKSFVFKVDDLSYDSNGKHEVTLVNLIDDKETVVKLDDTVPATAATANVVRTLTQTEEILETGVSINTILVNDTSEEVISFTLTGATLDNIYTKGGLELTFSTNSIVVAEMAVDDRDNTDLGNATITFTPDTPNTEIENIVFTRGSNVMSASSDNDDSYEYSNIGSLFTINEDSDKLVGYVPTTEIEHMFSFGTGNPTSKVTEVVTADKLDERFKVLKEEGYNPTKTEKESSDVQFDVSAPVKDSAASDMYNIVVGGPAVNSKAASLLGEGVVGVSEGQAVVRYFESSKSILVYGYSKAGTVAAAKKLTSGQAKDNQKFNE